MDASVYPPPPSASSSLLSLPTRSRQLLSRLIEILIRREFGDTGGVSLARLTFASFHCIIRSFVNLAFFRFVGPSTNTPQGIEAYVES